MIRENEEIIGEITGKIRDFVFVIFEDVVQNKTEEKLLEQIKSESKNTSHSPPIRDY